jgi:hypothetical protein
MNENPNKGHEDNSPDKSYDGITGNLNAKTSPNHVKNPCSGDDGDESIINDSDEEEETCPHCNRFLDFDEVEDKWAYWKAHRTQCRKERKETAEGANAAICLFILHDFLVFAPSL